MAPKFVICVPVADLRREPAEIPTHDYSHQDLRETQLLFGEKLICLREHGQWLKISALEQECYDPKIGWHAYLGWIKKTEAKAVQNFAQPTHVVNSLNNALFSYGTLLTEHRGSFTRPIPRIPCRKTLVEDALAFLGQTYLWGGRSCYAGAQINSIDCSGFINLLYRAQGICLPRDAHDQYLRCHPTNNLKPADLIYLAKDKRINHVILKVNEGRFIESPETGKTVRLLHWGKEIWRNKGRIYIFDRSHSYTPYGGTFTL